MALLVKPLLVTPAFHTRVPVRVLSVLFQVLRPLPPTQETQMDSWLWLQCAKSFAAFWKTN